MKNIFLLGVALAFIVSCKTKNIVTTPEMPQKPTVVKPETTSESKEELINKNMLYNLNASHNAFNRNFKTAQIQSRISYKDAKMQESINAEIRIEKGKQILVNVKIAFLNVAKVYITPDRVSYYEIINGTHYDGDFNIVKKMIGTDVNYNQVENIFLGKTIYSLSDNNLKIKDLDTKYLVEKIVNEYVIAMTLKENGQLVQEQIKSGQSNIAEISYPGFQTINGVYFPNGWKLNSSFKKPMNVEIQYESIKLNDDLNFKYQIPSGSKAIKI